MTILMLPSSLTYQWKVLANNIRSQVRKEREALNLANTETGTIEQETKRIHQGLNQITKNREFHKVFSLNSMVV